MTVLMQWSRSDSGRRLAWFILAAVLGLALARLPLLLAGVLVIGLAAGLLMLIHPLFGLLLALLAGPWGALEAVILGGGLPLDSGQVLLFLTIAVWLARGARRRRIVLPATPLNGPLLLFGAVAVISLLAAPSLVYGIKELVKWVEIGVVMWLLVDLVPVERRALRWLALAILLAGVSQALIGIWQFGLRGTGPEHFIISGRLYRAYGTFEQPNPFGGFMYLNGLPALGWAAGLLAALAAGVWTGRSIAWPQLRHNWRRHGAWLLAAAAAAGALGLGLVFSWSRGAWLGFAAGLGVFVYLWPRRRWQGLALVVAGALLVWAGLQLGLLPEALSARLIGWVADFQLGDVRGVDINDANFSLLERLAHWEAALAMARDHIWLGVGFGNYEPAYAGYALLNWPLPLGHAHNYYLNLLAEVGVVGLTAYLLFWGAVLWLTGRCVRRLSGPERGLAVGLFAAWIALAGHHLLDKLYVNNIYVHLGAMLGLLVLLDRLADRPEPEAA